MIAQLLTLIRAVRFYCVVLLLLLSSAWLCTALYFQQPISSSITLTLQGAWLMLLLCVLVALFYRTGRYRLRAIVLHSIAFALCLVWYFNIPAQSNRQWNPEVARTLHYSLQGNIITLHNVRNFHWQQNATFTERWETRRYDLSQLQGVNVITSYWMGPQIAHTLVSFDFANAAPLVFSIEIRKERNEDFSAIGGFFRKFELSLVAADERDILYNRSNVRHEQLYFFPIQMPKAEQKALFLQYLNTADELRLKPRWYNTLSSNCTTLVFAMAQRVSPAPLPVDYRLLASGYLPNYLYDLKALKQDWTLKQWYAQAHVNPRTQYFDGFQYQSSANYSKLIRLGLPAANTPRRTP